MQEKITVIIPVYNTADYLDRCLNSVINNTYQNLEIICVNDGSTDNSLEILERYALKDWRIKIVNKPNGGLPTARNAGIEIATGNWIAHIDSDDWVHRQYFEVLMNGYERSGKKADIVMCRFRKVNQYTEDNPISMEHLPVKTGGWNLVKKERYFKIYVWARIYSRKLIGDFRQLDNINLGEDVYYNLNIIGRQKNICVSVCDCEPLYYYFQRSTSIIHTSSHKELILIPEEMLKNRDVICSGENEAFVGEALLKRVLSERYNRRYEDWTESEKLPDFKGMMVESLEMMRRSKCVSFWRIVLYSACIRIPLIYNIGRDIPEMIGEIKKRRKT